MHMFMYKDTHTHTSQSVYVVTLLTVGKEQLTRIAVHTEGQRETFICLHEALFHKLGWGHRCCMMFCVFCKHKIFNITTQTPGTTITIYNSRLLLQTLWSSIVGDEIMVKVNKMYWLLTHNLGMNYSTLVPLLMRGIEHKGYFFHKI